MDSNNCMEIFKATIEHRKHDKFMFYLEFIGDMEKRILEKYNVKSINQFNEMLEVPIWCKVSLKELSPPSFDKYYKDTKIPENSYIDNIGVLHIPGSIHHFTRIVSPLKKAKSLNDLEGYPYPSFDNYSEEGITEEVEKLHKKNYPVAAWVGHMYEAAWQIRGYEEFLVDMVGNPEMCEFILDMICERNVKYAETMAKAGVDVIRTGDDVANQNSMMFSPSLWRKFIKPRWAKVYEAAKSIKPDLQIWYHSDGNITEIIPELIDIGVNILNPLQPECLDVNKIKRKYGDKLVFDGTIGTQTTMPFGSKDEVVRVVRDRKKNVGYDGALILAPTHVIEPEVPLENVEAFIQACKE